MSTRSTGCLVPPTPPPTALKSTLKANPRRGGAPKKHHQPYSTPAKKLNTPLLIPTTHTVEDKEDEEDKEDKEEEEEE